MAFDYRERCIQLMEPFHPTGDTVTDVERLLDLIAFAQGCKARPTR